MAFRLFVDSSNGITIEPEYNFTEEDKKIENRYRARSATEYVYKWSDFKRWKMSTMYVNSEFKSIVNSWWNNNVDLLFKSESESAVYSVHLTGKKLPVGKFIKPYSDLFKAVIELETY